MEDTPAAKEGNTFTDSACRELVFEKVQQSIIKIDTRNHAKTTMSPSSL